jgi:hypothetical protein
MYGCEENLISRKAQFGSYGEVVNPHEDLGASWPRFDLLVHPYLACILIVVSLMLSA